MINRIRQKPRRNEMALTNNKRSSYLYRHSFRYEVSQRLCRRAKDIEFIVYRKAECLSVSLSECYGEIENLLY